MFRRYPRYPLTLFSEGVEIRGNLASAGVLEIKGTVRGDIDHQGKVVVGLTGSCESNIVASTVEVAGEVHGDVEADRLVIHSTGRLYGRANCAHLVVHDGGVLEDVASAALVGGGREELLATSPEATADEKPAGALLQGGTMDGTVDGTVDGTIQAACDALAQSPGLVRRKEPVFYTSF